MKFRALVISAVAVFALGGCHDRFPDYHYKMTVYVETSDGEKAFSSVREVDNREYRTILRSSGKGLKTTLRGEAVIIDLPGGASPVFALLASPKDPEYAMHIAGSALRPERRGDERGGDDAYARWMQHMAATKGSWELPHMRPTASAEGGMQDQWPLFVTFDDVNNPSTVHEVNPTEIGVKRITIEITKDSASRGIDGRLTWLARYDSENRRLNGRNNAAIGTSDLADNLSSGAFRQGD